MRRAHELLEPFRSATIRSASGMEGIATVAPVMEGGTLRALACLLFEGADGRPVASRATLPPLRSFADMVEVAVLDFLACPPADRPTLSALEPFLGDPDRRRGRFRDLVSGWDIPEDARILVTDALHGSLCSAFGRSGLTPAFRAGLMTGEMERDRFAVFARTPAGDRLRAFAVAYPVLVPLVADSRQPTMCTDPHRGMALLQPGLTPAHLSRFSGRRPIIGIAAAPRSNVHGGGRVRRLLRIAASLPVDWMPRDARGFEDFTAMAEAADAASVPGGPDAAVLLSRCAGRWGDLRSRFEQALPNHLGKPGYVTSHVADGPRDLARRILLPLAGGRILARGGDARDAERALAGRAMPELDERAAGAFLGGKSLMGAIEAGTRWHRALSLVDAAMPMGKLSDASWPGLFEPCEAPNGLTLVCLTSARELFDEGAPGPDVAGARGLAHCVGTRRATASAGTSYVLSIRRIAPDGTYERLSTAEIMPGKPGAPYQVIQHRGFANGSPAAEAHEALAWLVAECPFAPWRLSHAIVGEIERICGFDWKDPGLLRKAVEAYQPAMPRALRGLCPDALRGRLDLGAVGRG